MADFTMLVNNNSAYHEYCFLSGQAPSLGVFNEVRISVANRDYHYRSQNATVLGLLVISGVGVEKLADWQEF